MDINMSDLNKVPPCQTGVYNLKKECLTLCPTEISCQVFGVS